VHLSAGPSSSNHSMHPSAVNTDTPLRPDPFPVITPNTSTTGTAATRSQKPSSTVQHAKKSAPKSSSRSSEISNDNQNSHGPRVRRSPQLNACDSSAAAAPTPPPNPAGPDRDVPAPGSRKARDDFTVDIRVAPLRRPIAESAGGVASASDGDVKSLASMDVHSVQPSSSFSKERHKPTSGMVNAEDFLRVNLAVF